MRILIDVLHPAHVHFFRHFRTEMLRSGAEVTVVARDKDVTLDLLDGLGIPYELISRQARGTVGLGREAAIRIARLARLARRLRPTLMMGIMGVSVAPVGRLLGIPSVVLYDTEVARRTNRLVYPLASVVVTPDCYQGKVMGRHVRYRGYHELAYLHPGRFTPDPDRVVASGLSTADPYVLVRFVSWEASHDHGDRGLTHEQKRGLVSWLSTRARVVISSEKALPHDLEPLRLRAPVAHIHDLVAHASLVIGESATMASEAAVLGVPSVLMAGTSRGYIDDQESRYGLTRHVHPGDLADGLRAAEDALNRPASWRARQRRRLLDDHVDVTGWLTAFVSGRFR